MREKIDLMSLCGISGYITCEYCKGKCRFPGGKYRDQGEIVNCPICDGLGATRVFLDLDQFAQLVTIVATKAKARSRGRTRSQRQVRDVRRSARRS